MEINSAIEQFTYIGDVHDDDLRCKLSLFSAVVSELLFDDLRGKEQLGYIVRFRFLLSQYKFSSPHLISSQILSGVRKSCSFMGCRVVIQSEYDTNFLEGRLNASWVKIRAKLVEMEEAEFNKYKQTVVDDHLKDHENMWQECVLSTFIDFGSPSRRTTHSTTSARTGQALCGFTSRHGGTTLSRSNVMPSLSRR
jgi:insulysin